MVLSVKRIVSSALVTSALLSPLASANNVNLGAYTIPASACQPTNSLEDEKLKLLNGAYVFRANETGSASLLCPLPLNGWRAGVDLFNQDFNDPTLNMTSFRVYYRDPNNCNTASGVQVRLRYRTATGLNSLNPNWVSWQTTQPGEFCFPGISTNTTREVPLVHSLRDDRLYHFLVIIKRSSTSESVVFSGIDFPINIVNPG
ncbi:hypothetical protein [Aliikangiella sp. IMCC44359]|uniref:hypothetical protein n=1 Tax=Aliikangiella sp. IMCC44359 TaxID=3459125 RepID=UPI00403AD9A7